MVRHAAASIHSFPLSSSVLEAGAHSNCHSEMQETPCTNHQSIAVVWCPLNLCALWIEYLPSSI